jgi:Predicted nucleic acid-binding protein, contains PIN domain
MILLDSNILVYSINSASPKNQKSRDFIIDNQDNLCVAHQNILETLRVLTHPKFPNPISSSKAVEAVTSITDNLKIISPNFETQFVAIELIKKYKIVSDQIFDTYLVSTMLTNDVFTVATDNEKDFRNFKEIKVDNPFKKLS